MEQSISIDAVIQVLMQREREILTLVSENLELKKRLEAKAPKYEDNPV